MVQKGKQNSALISEAGASCSASVNQTAILGRSENPICQRRVCRSHFAGYFKVVLPSGNTILLNVEKRSQKVSGVFLLFKDYCLLLGEERMLSDRDPPAAG